MSRRSQYGLSRPVRRKLQQDREGPRMHGAEPGVVAVVDATLLGAINVAEAQ
jgi:hypothetical protein